MAAPQPVAQAPEAPPSAQVVGNAFVQQYYLVLHQSPDLAIGEKIMEMDVSKAEIRTVDSQESLGGGVTVLVTGHLTGRDGVRREFSQSFFLAPQEKGYFVLNDMFRFVGEIPAPTAVEAQPEADAVVLSVAANGTSTLAVEPATPDDCSV
ncbi:putative G3BP-like protein [Zea mays]|uniref:Putative G3BP-like protein n=1 Tax=Zea mays TaxID=4577 RepID=A0A3L6EZ23_MAIZE|nr:putative G3BP-like protein [Zea mays]